MALHDTEALVIETSTAAESLPDPTAFVGRTHRLTNTHTAAAVWSSVGATPFVDAAGAAVATLTVGAGEVVQVQSDGARWAVKAPASSRRVFSATGVTDAGGNVTFTFVPPFASAPVVTNAVQTAVTDSTECRVSALSASSVTFAARRSPAVTLLGISVLQASIPLAGATVHCHAVAAGQT